MSIQNQHPHKAIIDAWAADVTTRVEAGNPDGTWHETTLNKVIHNVYESFRIKPKMRSATVDGVTYEFPEPMRVAPEDGTVVWLTDFNRCHQIKFYISTPWQDRVLKAGFCHLTEEAAEQHLRALIAVNGGVK